MKLKIPNGNEEGPSEEIKVKVWTERTKGWLEPPILIQKHELVRWQGDFCIEDGELLLQDGYCESWNEANDCISLLKGLEVDVTFENIKVSIYDGVINLSKLPQYVYSTASLS
jgi:hypothetical protein